MASCSITTQNLLGVPGVQEQISQRVIRVLEKDGQHQPHECILDSIINSKREEAFYVLDLDVVTTLYDKWTSTLPMIQPFYAVKCNPDKALLGALAALGSNFDCASQAEIESVLSLGVSPTRIIYANPCKADSHLKFAASVGVNLTTFDSREELDKIKMWHPKCSLLIRIKVPDDGKAIMPLSSKFGALPMEVVPLLDAAKAMKLNVMGVSFHVGSAVTDAGAYLEAIAETKRVFDTAVQLGMPKLRVLDIGGGFIAGPIFDQVATNVKAALEAHFTNELQPGLNLSVISEPGRFFAETPFTLATTIIGKRVRGEVREYWINDGTFGSFICVMFDALSAPIKCIPLACTSNSENVTCQGLKTYSSQVFGPTLDSCDVVLRGYQLLELEVNDWLVFPKLGAYTACLGSSFNGFNTPTVSTYLVTPNNN